MVRYAFKSNNNITRDEQASKLFLTNSFPAHQAAWRGFECKPSEGLVPDQDQAASRLAIAYKTGIP